MRSFGLIAVFVLIAADAGEFIRNATVLQAPPLEKGKYHETGDFGRMMKDLAENEVKFREAKAPVYRSTFDQRALQSTPVLKRFHAFVN